MIIQEMFHVARNCIIMLNNYICFFLAVILFNACSSNQVETAIVRDGDVYIVDLDNTPKDATVKFSSLFRSAKFILLEDSEDALFAKINKIEVSDSYIFVLERERGLYLFDKNGKFIRTIGRKGGGPGEFISLSDFSINENKKEISLLDRRTQTVIKYTFEGKYLDSFRLLNDETISSFLYSSNDQVYTDLYYFSGADEGFLLRRMDTLGQNVSYSLPIIEYTKGWNELIHPEQELFVTVGKEARFIQVFMDTIMRITADGVSPYIALESRRLTTVEDLKKEEGSSGKEEQLKERLLSLLTLNGKNKVYNIDNYFESDDHIYFECEDGSEKCSVLIDAKNNKIKLFGELYNDVVFSGETEYLMPTRFKCTDEGGVYAVMMNSDLSREDFLKKIRENSLNENLGQETISRLKTLSYDSNPIIVYYEYAD